MSKRALLVVNPQSRCGSAGVDVAIAQLRKRGVEILEPKLERPEQIQELIRRHCNEVDCVIVGGGDGSMNAAAPALMATGLALGVLPMGTANDLARTLHIPADLEQASEIIASGVTHRIDLGLVNGRHFFNVAHIGLGVHVTHHLSADLKQRWGVLSYARSLVKAIKSLRPFHADIVCDGRRRRVHSIQIAVGNGRHYGGGMTVAEEASIDDHRFSLYSIEPLRWWDLLRFAPAFLAGRFEESHPVDIEQGRCIEIATRKAMAVSADGEIVAHTPALFDLVPGAVKVFVPARYFKEMRHATQE